MMVLSYVAELLESILPEIFGSPAAGAKLSPFIRAGATGNGYINLIHLCEKRLWQC